jgi:ubiquinone/menaquinone biosynthesis C-methylase UbiE
MHIRMWAIGAAVCLMPSPPLVIAQDSKAPKGIESEQSLPGRHLYVVQDALRLCKPMKGFWVDLGAGKGQIAIPLVEASGNPVVMVDPDREAIAEGLELARKKGIADRLFAVVGRAEELPLADNTVDFVVSRGSIFFWDNPSKGLREVHRVLRPGGKAFIGGGAGSGYPKSAVEKLIQQRKTQLQGEDGEKWRRFVELRRPEQMKKWAEEAGLSEYEVMGKGAISADDETVGQGVWLMFEKKTHSKPSSQPEGGLR